MRRPSPRYLSDMMSKCGRTVRLARIISGKFVVRYRRHILTRFFFETAIETPPREARTQGPRLCNTMLSKNSVVMSIARYRSEGSKKSHRAMKVSSTERFARSGVIEMQRNRSSTMSHHLGEGMDNGEHLAESGRLNCESNNLGRFHYIELVTVFFSIVECSHEDTEP